MSEKLKPKTLEIHFGAFADSISKQLKRQGFKFNKKDVVFFEKELDAITRLKFASLITESIAKKPIINYTEILNYMLLK